jgi:hypothetical protein
MATGVNNITALSQVDSQQFQLILLKPSHYDDDYYVIS